ncbi:MAG: PAS domain-containing protein [Venatoribacter sp.]
MQEKKAPAHDERKRLETILDAIQCGIWEWRIDERRVVLDERWAGILGYRLDELGEIKDETFLSFIHPDDRQKNQDAYYAHINGQTDRYSVEVRVLHKDGRWRWVLDSGKITDYDKAGKPLKMIGARLDITDRKLAEEAYRLENERFAALAKITKTGVWEWNKQTQRLSCSDEYFQMLGYTAQDFGNRTQHDLDSVWSALLHPEDAARANATFSQYLSTNRRGVYESTFRLRHAQGGWVWVLSRGNTLLDAQGNPTETTIGAHINISSLIEAKTELKANQERLKLISDSLPNAVLFQLDCGLRGEMRRFTYLSDGVERIHGLKVDKTLADASLLYQQLLPDDRERMAKLEAISIRDMSDCKVEVRSLVADGSQRWFMIISTPRKLDNGHIVFDGIELDVTEQKLYEQQISRLNTSLELRVQERTQELTNTLAELKRTQTELLENEKLASLGSLVAGVAHELNTPIGNALMVASSLTTATQQIKEQVKHGLTRSALENYLNENEEGGKIVERNLMRSAELIRSFKQLAIDQTSYQRRTFELQDLIREIAVTLHPTLRKTPHQLENNVPEGLVFDSYPGPLGQVIINLINNALVHAFEEGSVGVISIQAQLIEIGWVSITVRDNGMGISSADQKKIFDPFFTTKLGHGGSGLGLHIVYSLVTGLLGGRIQVKSEEQIGTEMIITLPMKAPENDADELAF